MQGEGRAKWLASADEHANRFASHIRDIIKDVIL
jgi:hypothetical protein